MIHIFGDRYIPIRTPTVAVVATTATGRKKRNRNRKEKKIAVAVQHPCQLRADPPPALCLLNPTYIARRDLSLFFSIDIVYDVILSNHFIHSSAFLATLRYATLKKPTDTDTDTVYLTPYPPLGYITRNTTACSLARSLASKNPHQNHKKPSPP